MMPVLDFGRRTFFVSMFFRSALQVLDHIFGKATKRLCSFCGEVSNDSVNQAQRTDVNALRQRERCACVEADVGRAQNILIVCKAWVCRSVSDDKHSIKKNSARAKRPRAWDARQAHSACCLEPLTPLVDEGDIGDGDLEKIARVTADSVKLRLCFSVEDFQTFQSGEALSFSGRHKSRHEPPFSSIIT